MNPRPSTKRIASLLALILGTHLAHALEAPTKPNVIYILCDDLGYGDVHCLNPQRGKIATPNADRLAAQGMIFTDAHSGSSVCTPTRYGIITGRYAWRTKLQSGVLSGTSPALIPPTDSLSRPSSNPSATPAPASANGIWA